MARLSLTVPPAAGGERLDRLVAGAPGIGTRSRAKQLIDAGRVRVGGTARRAAYVVRAGDAVEIDVPPPEPSGIEPEALPLSVVYEDAHLLAVDKAAGMVVHPAPGARRGTLVHALAHRLGPLAGVGEAGRPGIVHRLDRDTSGVLLVARTPEALEGLARQFRERTLEKRYLAVVCGRMAAASGTIDRPIGRHPVERKQMSVRSRRPRAAVTRFEVVERFAAATVVRLFPKTGRTHQLRVHLAALGHPIVGDRLYGRGRVAPPAPLAGFPRQALHAAEIAFAHPVTGAPLRLRAPLPADLEGLLASLRQGGGTTGKTGRLA